MAITTAAITATTAAMRASVVNTVAARGCRQDRGWGAWRGRGGCVGSCPRRSGGVAGGATGIPRDLARVFPRAIAPLICHTGEMPQSAAPAARRSPATARDVAIGIVSVAVCPDVVRPAHRPGRDRVGAGGDHGVRRAPRCLRRGVAEAVTSSYGPAARRGGTDVPQRPRLVGRTIRRLRPRLRHQPWRTGRPAQLLPSLQGAGSHGRGPGHPRALHQAHLRPPCWSSSPCTPWSRCRSFGTARSR